MKYRLIPIVVVLSVTFACLHAVQPQRQIDRHSAAGILLDDDLQPVVDRVDQMLSEQWQAEDLQPAATADDLVVLRRLTLSLMGTVPSLEEIRQFESDTQPDRLRRWTRRILDDRRYADYMAERLSRCFVGTEDGPFVVFRRDRFGTWLSDELRGGRPYDEIVRQMLATEGLWTDEPQSNFVTVARQGGGVDANKLAARSARAFLGTSIDCAQCHNHPYAEWSQDQFEGIAAHFGQVSVGVLGVADRRGRSYVALDRSTGEEHKVDPSVPWNKEWLPEGQRPREQFAAWVTHPENRRFERSIVNRMWGLMFGQPWIQPVDDMPEPPPLDQPDLLDVLASDFREHHCDLKRLVQVIAACRAFRLDSRHSSDDESEIIALESSHAIFPLTRLRPEQVIGSMMQASFIQTIDQNSHLLVRFRRFTSERDFVRAYGDVGDQELSEQPGTIPQALLRMNSRITRETIKSDFFNASGRITSQCESDQAAVNTAWQVCLTRPPTDQESEYFVGQLAGTRDKARAAVMEDIFWCLFNSEEFSWNH